MKAWFSAVAWVVGGLLQLSVNTWGASREAEWQKVQEALSQRQPRTALEQLEPILQAAQRESAWAEVGRALAQKVAIETSIQGDQPIEYLRRLEAALPGAPAAVQPLLRTLLGHAYWAYYQENRWRFASRTATTEVPGDDVETWDLPRIFAAIDAHFTAALAEPRALQSVPISTYRDLLTPSGYPERYRPTLYDFLVHQALEFYAAGEQPEITPTRPFQVPAGSPVLASREEFLAWNVPEADLPAVLVRALRLWQDVLRFHQANADPTALLDADLGRLEFGARVLGTPDSAVAHSAALREFAARHAANEVSAMARWRAATLLRGHDAVLEAHGLASEAVRTFPESPGGKQAAQLVQEIERPAFSIDTERVWNAPWPDVEIEHRNLPRLWFRLVKADWNEFLDQRRSRPEHLRPEERAEFLRRPPAREWNVELPATPGFTNRITRLPVPADLPPGFYFLFSGEEAAFNPDQKPIRMTTVWVSDLALVVWNRAGYIEGLVTLANAGTPVAGARVEGWRLEQGQRVPALPVTSNADGFFRLEGVTGHGYLVKATHEAHAIASQDEFAFHPQTAPDQADFETVLFTDRALYRPGQSVQYKGIVVVNDRARQRFEVLQDRQVTLSFRDPNGEEIVRRTHRTNPFGSFSGSVTAPSGRLAGSYQLVITEGSSGERRVQVEEYKRPTFLVQIDPPSTPARLGAAVTLTGRATSYSGAAVDGAKVSWRVERRSSLPFWIYRFGPGPQGDAQAIAQGEATTGADGTFQVPFTATGDPSIPETDGPIFHFEVHADVTDPAGETRSADRTLALSPVAVQAAVRADDWQVAQRPVEFTVETRTVDGDGTPAAGTLEVVRLIPPAQVERPSLRFTLSFRWRPPGGLPQPPESESFDWEVGEVVHRADLRTGTNGLAQIPVTLGAGAYRARLTVRDAGGKEVRAQVDTVVLDPASPRFPLPLPSHLAAESWTVEPGNDLRLAWGTGYPEGRAFIRIERQQRILQQGWTTPERTQVFLSRAVTEDDRGGFTVHVTFVRENRLHTESREVVVPWSNRDLKLAWKTFRNRLEPGSKEEWSLTVQTPGGKAPASPTEVVATLYDASLDQFLGFTWPESLPLPPQIYSTTHAWFANQLASLQHFLGDFPEYPFVGLPSHADFRPELLPPSRRGVLRAGGLRVSGLAPRMMSRTAMALSAAPAAPAAAMVMDSAVAEGAFFAKGTLTGTAGGTPPAATAPTTISPRRNLQETAFFFPHLQADSNGLVRLTFTLPEAITEWRFLGFAHDPSLRAGLLEGRTVTRRELMVRPNPPRFLREGDVLEYTARIQNQSDRPLSGTVTMGLRHLATDAPAEAAFGLSQPTQPFEVPARESRTVSWKLTVPDGPGFVVHRVTATAGTLGDAEEAALPILSRRVLLTESLPLTLRGPGRREAQFQALAESGRSPTLRHVAVSAEVSSNPAWDAVLALPYLMEFPHECAEQLFNRYYANAVASHVAQSDPRIRATFDQWRNTEALQSPLQRNPDLRAVALEETPWLRDAREESEARRNLGVLFDQNRLDAEARVALERLTAMRRADGLWPWFPGGPADEYISLYIVTGLGRLRALGLNVDNGLAIAALTELDRRWTERHQEIVRRKKTEEPALDPLTALYVYARSLFSDRPAQGEPTAAAFEFWLQQGIRHWNRLPSRQSEGHLALALHHFGAQQRPEAARVAQTILRSLRERAVTDPELGMFWRDEERHTSWYRAPIETQALMIEVFATLGNDAATVEELKLWLLRQKQTRHWRTTKGTADAVYALLRRGSDLLQDTGPLKMSLGGLPVTPEITLPTPGKPAGTEPGTGYFRRRFAGDDVTPALARVTLEKPGQGVAWGALHWQYLEDLGAVKPYEGSPLRLRKELFLVREAAAGKELLPLPDSVPVGAELVVRVELRVDRDLEYVHLKDARGSGTEPVNVLSGYRFQDGLGYYESTRDTASHFFISYLPKGTYVFEYPLRVQHRGTYPAGITEVQCMYAPEFNSHSAGALLNVR